MLYKTDWNGTALAGAVFELKNEDGNHVAAPRYTSDSDGLITIAYLNDGSYTLSEISTPRGYAAAEEPVTITVSGSRISVEGTEGSFIFTKATNTQMASVIVKNRTAALQIRKVDANNPEESALEGAEFDLYRITENAPEGEIYLEGLISDENGMLAKNGATEFQFPVGSYYLMETKAPEGYRRRGEKAEFEITKEDGEQGVLYQEGASLSENDGIRFDAETGVYTMRISNTRKILDRILPHTGGSGTGILYLLGAILIGFAGAALVLRKRRTAK